VRDQEQLTLDTLTCDSRQKARRLADITLPQVVWKQLKRLLFCLRCSLSQHHDNSLTIQTLATSSPDLLLVR